MIKAVIPELIKEAGSFRVFTIYSETAADHILRCELDNTAGKRVLPPGFEGLSKDISKIIRVAVSVGLRE